MTQLISFLCKVKADQWMSQGLYQPKVLRSPLSGILRSLPVPFDHEPKPGLLSVNIHILKMKYLRLNCLHGKWESNCMLFLISAMAEPNYCAFFTNIFSAVRFKFFSPFQLFGALAEIFAAHLHFRLLLSLNCLKVPSLTSTQMWLAMWCHIIILFWDSLLAKSIHDQSRNLSLILT